MHEVLELKILLKNGLRQVRTIRMVGSAALMLAWIGAGRADAYWEPDLNAWDTAAGALFIQEVRLIENGRFLVWILNQAGQG